jgi:hypothetical protein
MKELKVISKVDFQNTNSHTSYLTKIRKIGKLSKIAKLITYGEVSQQ